MNIQPRALGLADVLDAGENFYAESSLWFDQELSRAVQDAAAELRRLHELNGQLHEANEAFGKRQEWWDERMFRVEERMRTLEQQRDELLAALVSFTKSGYIRHQHPKRFAAAVAAIVKTESTK